ncbi:hypothetical protein LCGC14_1892960 [marine sediment metagenome]|uniref:Uncharacterized protein n=1 Tax=marine sediment metagenome TaxID=412755 RepID=A0A0F9FZ65_9ZZZZ
MKVEFKECIVDEDCIKLVAEFTTSFPRGKDFDEEMRSLPFSIVQKIADKAATEYLSEHKVDLLDNLNADQLINALKLKIIDSFSMGGQSFDMP